ncbi:MAG: hypothetical protein Alis3KO_41530 [Aliiglaciecola sp.]
MIATPLLFENILVSSRAQDRSEIASRATIRVKNTKLDSDYSPTIFRGGAWMADVRDVDELF